MVLVVALAVAFVAAVPVFAQEETTAEPTTAEPATEEDGGTVQPQIVGGEPVSNGEYPFVAALLDVTRGNTVAEQLKCGATLIDPDSVLTAARCVDEGLKARRLRVTVGITNLRKQQGQARRVEAISIHPRYDETSSYRYDAAVLELARPVEGIEPVRIPATDSNGFETPGRRATITGWGNTIKQPPDGDNGSNYPSRMRETRVPVVSDAKAKRLYRRAYTTGLMLAAGREGKDSCGGDSGGPLFFPQDDASYQVGITSFGLGCGSRRYPGVYTEANAAQIRPFIFTAAGN